MHFDRTPFRSFVAAFLAVISLSILSVAQTAQPDQPALSSTESAQRQQSFSNVRIKNFGQMDERFYRGAQPKVEDYKDLKALGITTVIDLQDTPKAYEKGEVEALGMRYVNIPMSDKDYPEESRIEAFLKLVEEPSTGKFFVHCAGGRHRTGVMGAVYRFNHYGWNYEQVYKEMKDFDFYTRWGHGDMKKYVEDYWQRIQTHPGPAQSSTVVTSHATQK